MNPINVLVFQENVATLLEIIEHLAMVKPKPSYQVIVETLTQVNELVKVKETDAGRLIECIQQTQNLLGKLGGAHNCAGCNYAAEQFEKISLAFLNSSDEQTQPQP